MYEKIFVPVDNSAHSKIAVDLAVLLAAGAGARLVGGHAYAARLHDLRFKQMEFSLPEEYLEETELEKQRDIHDSLITKGLELISDSYLVSMSEKASDAGVEFEPRTYNGRNYEVLAADIRGSDYDLVVMGALGQGAVRRSQIGSVCERVVRRIRTDTMVIKNVDAIEDQLAPGSESAGIVVTIDGSHESFAGLKTAIELAKRFKKPIEAISVFDPHLHDTLFKSLEKVLTEEAAEVFNFKEQEKLHKSVIDDGLAMIYRSHLEVARKLAEQDGVDLKITLLDGKVFERVLEFVDEVKPWLLVVGRIGVHSDESMDMGSNAENLLRLAECNVLLSSRRFVPDVDLQAEEVLVWSEPALEILTRAPGMARGIARTIASRWALERGHSVITTSILEQALSSILPRSSLKAMGIRSPDSETKPADSPAREAISTTPPEASTQPSRVDLTWTPEALERLNRIPEGFMRNATKMRVEEFARQSQVDTVGLEMVEKGIAEGRKSMGSRPDDS